MPVFKCKMCGGALEIEVNATTAECEYCGSNQTLPNLSNDKLERLYDRANHFRRNNEYDKAMGIYEQILEETENDAEVYWSLILCKYGIEYVDDPATRRRIPTVNRAQLTSIFDDENYKKALQYADTSQRAIYEEEAKQINEIQKGILAISQNEEPFDVFICYKETDENGQRTRDSLLANDLYHELTKEGFKVFYARITLEDKLGQAYEPYIFAALNSAKIMVVIGSKPEYFEAVWVKNEWSRFLAMMKKGEKKTLIPAYSGMDPYDLPEEFSHLQAQDMMKLGFMPDLIRGIKKLIGVEEAPVKAMSAAAPAAGGAGIDSLLKRVEIFLDSYDWNSANTYCEKVLDMDPENSKAYVYKLLSQAKAPTVSDLSVCKQSLESFGAYRSVLRYGDPKVVEEIIEYNNKIKAKISKEEAIRKEEAKKKEHLEYLKNEKAKAESRLSQMKNRVGYLQQEMKNMNINKNRTLEVVKLIVALLNIALTVTTIIMLMAGADDAAAGLFMFTCLIFPIALAILRDTSKLLAVIGNCFTYGIWNIVVSVKVIKNFAKELNGHNSQYSALAQEYNNLIVEIQNTQNYLNQTVQNINNMYK